MHATPNCHYTGVHCRPGPQPLKTVRILFSVILCLVKTYCHEWSAAKRADPKVSKLMQKMPQDQFTWSSLIGIRRLWIKISIQARKTEWTPIATNHQLRVRKGFGIIHFLLLFLAFEVSKTLRNCLGSKKPAAKVHSNEAGLISSRSSYLQVLCKGNDLTERWVTGYVLK